LLFHRRNGLEFVWDLTFDEPVIAHRLVLEAHESSVRTIALPNREVALWQVVTAHATHHELTAPSRTVPRHAFTWKPVHLPTRTVNVDPPVFLISLMVWLRQVVVLVLCFVVLPVIVIVVVVDNQTSPWNSPSFPSNNGKVLLDLC
jgi:hypothetical protein